ncbi:MAG: WG repeat-containing protein, partial [Bacillota bacterium]|nr:WG repeat-containing protein [Bacillota bacterium]
PVGKSKYASKDYFAVATPFKNGKAVVMRKTNASLLESNTLEQMEKKELFESAYVINSYGQVESTLPLGYDVTDYGLNNDTVIVRDMTKQDANYGVTKTDGTVLIPCIYQDIEYCEDDLFLVQNENGFFGFVAPTSIVKIDFKFESAYPFSNGYAAVKENGLWGIIDKEGKYIIEPKFNDITKLVRSDVDINVNGAAVANGIFVAQYGAYWGMFNLKGEILDAIYAPNAESPYYNQSAGQFIVYKEYKEGIASGYCGLLDLNGNQVLPAEYTYIGCFDK